MPDPIRMDEWLAELQRLGSLPQADNGLLTVNEMAAHLGRSINWVRTKLAEASRQGLLIVGQKQLTCISGRDNMVPAYRVDVPKRKKAKK